MSDDLIRRSDAIKAVNKAKAEGMTECPTYYLGIVPTIEPKRGEWIDYKNGWKCNACEKWNSEKSNFCPNCGCAMTTERQRLVGKSWMDALTTEEQAELLADCPWL